MPEQNIQTSIYFQVLGNLRLSDFTSWLYPLISEKQAMAEGYILECFTNNYPSREY